MEQPFITSPSTIKGMMVGLLAARLPYIPIKDTTETSTKAHWKHMNLTMSTAVEMPAGILLSRSR